MSIMFDDDGRIMHDDIDDDDDDDDDDSTLGFRTAKISDKTAWRYGSINAWRLFVQFEKPYLNTGLYFCNVSAGFWFFLSSFRWVLNFLLGFEYFHVFSVEFWTLMKLKNN